MYIFIYYFISGNLSIKCDFQLEFPFASHRLDGMSPLLHDYTFVCPAGEPMAFEFMFVRMVRGKNINSS